VAHDVGATLACHKNTFTTIPGGARRIPDDDREITGSSVSGFFHRFLSACKPQAAI
jgi:hypothetical protein